MLHLVIANFSGDAIAHADVGDVGVGKLNH